MLTLTPSKSNVIVCHIQKQGSKKLTPVYYHPIIRAELRNSIDSLGYFFADDHFRDRFELSDEEALAIPGWHLPKMGDQRCFQTQR